MYIPPTSLYGALGAARQGLFTSQASLSVTGQNIANVNTPGYTRQRANLHALNHLGGSTVNGIDRLRNTYLDKQRSDATQAMGFNQQRHGALTQLEAILDETNIPGAKSMLNDLFRAMQDLSLRPSGMPEREGVRAAADALAKQINTMHHRLSSLRKNQDLAIRDNIRRINEISSEIATLNKQISQPRILGMNTNEMEDRRTELVRQLSELTSVQTFNEVEGDFTVIVANGLTLVEGLHRSELVPLADADNDGMTNIGLQQSGGTVLDVTSRIQSGEIGGLIQARDGDIRKELENIDRLAAELTRSFNQVHQQGFNLGDPPAQGFDFFRPLDVHVQASAGNQGTGEIVARTITVQAALTLDNYEIRIGGGGTYEIVNRSTGVSSGPQPLTVNAPIEFDGISVAIAGSPQEGDVFVVNTTTNAARRFDLAQEIRDDLGNIAASGDGASGDNTNALALADLQNRGVFSGRQMTFDAFLNGNLSALAVQVSQTGAELESQQLTVHQIEGFIEQLSGVSLDEESTLLIQYERAFQANSRVITAVDQMLQTVLNMI